MNKEANLATLKRFRKFHEDTLSSIKYNLENINGSEYYIYLCNEFNKTIERGIDEFFRFLDKEEYEHNHDSYGDYLKCLFRNTVDSPEKYYIINKLDNKHTMYKYDSFAKLNSMINNYATEEYIGSVDAVVKGHCIENYGIIFLEEFKEQCADCFIYLVWDELYENVENNFIDINEAIKYCEHMREDRETEPIRMIFGKALEFEISKKLDVYHE